MVEKHFCRRHNLRMRSLNWYLSIAIVVFNISSSNAFCDHPITRNDDIYVLSDKPTTYSKAEEMCQSYGGNLAQINNQNERQFFHEYLKRKYLSDHMLTKVNILSKRASFSFSNHKTYKYTSTNGRDGTSTTGYTTPRGNELKSISLYNRSLANFENPVQFCGPRDQDLIKSECNFDGIDVFILYGGNSQSNKTIQVYNYLVQRYGSRVTSKLSLNPNLRFGLSTNTPNIYLPDISVFIGARSGVSQSKWFWNDGTMITDRKYPTSNTPVCQQMTWPLTYDDGINLRAKECGLGESHYICRVKPRASVEEVDCDGTSLRLSLPNNITGILPNATIQVKISDETTSTFTLENWSITIGNLSQRTNYSLQVSFYSIGCQVGPTFTATGRTGRGVPDPVTSAFVLNSSSPDCLISWKKSRSNEEEISYKITSTTNETKKIATISPNSSCGEALASDNSMKYKIDLSAHEYNSVVSFQIQAVSSCGKISKVAMVNGTCISPTESSNAGFPSIAIIGIAAGFGVIFIVAGILAICFCKRKKTNQLKTAEMSMSRLPTQPMTNPCSVNPAIDETYLQPNCSHIDCGSPVYENCENTYETFS